MLYTNEMGCISKYRKTKALPVPKKFGIEDSQPVLDKQKGKGCLGVLSPVRVFLCVCEIERYGNQ